MFFDPIHSVIYEKNPKKAAERLKRRDGDPGRSKKVPAEKGAPERPGRLFVIRRRSASFRGFLEGRRFERTNSPSFSGRSGIGTGRGVAIIPSRGGRAYIEPRSGKALFFKALSAVPSIVFSNGSFPQSFLKTIAFFFDFVIIDILSVYYTGTILDTIYYTGLPRSTLTRGSPAAAAVAGGEKRRMMNNDVLIAFGVFQIVFLILDIIILANTGRNIARKDEYTWFYVLIVTHMAYLLLNDLWTTSEYGLLKLPPGATLFVCTVCLWTVTVCATAFFMFSVERLNVRRLRTGAGRWLRWLPAAFSTALIFSSAWTGWVFYLDEKGSFIHGPAYLPMMASAGLYLLVIAGVSFVNIFRKKRRFLRKVNAAFFVSVLIILAFIAVDSFLAKASVLPAAIFAVIAGIFITMQVDNINSDALTGMNNRRKAEDYLSDKIKNASEKKPVYLFMGDLNGFKKINDTFGHAAGDEALILCSRALGQTMARYGGFAARYGGDEFLFSWQPDRETGADPDALTGDLNARLLELSGGKPYKLEMTVGHVRCADPKESLLSYVRQADGMLYRRKRAAGVGR